MPERYMVVSHPDETLVVAVCGPYRSYEKAERVADSLMRTADAHAELANAIPQVVRIESIAAVRRQIAGED